MSDDMNVTSVYVFASSQCAVVFAKDLFFMICMKKITFSSHGQFAMRVFALCGCGTVFLKPFSD
jgi:hypothetical protein